MLEPEVMDSLEEAMDYDRMDHGEVNRRFVDDFLAAWQATIHADSQDPASREILDLGTGTAQIPVELCERTRADAGGGQERAPPPWRVLAVDLAASMLELARVHIEARGLSNQIRTDLVDAKQLPYADRRFRAVMSNSIVHHIPQPERVLAEARRVTAPAGLLFFRDLLRPASNADLERLVELYAAGANAHQRQMFAASLHAALGLEEVRAMVGDLGFDPAGVQQTSDRHWTWSAKRGE